MGGQIFKIVNKSETSGSYPYYFIDVRTFNNNMNKCAFNNIIRTTTLCIAFGSTAYFIYRMIK